MEGKKEKKKQKDSIWYATKWRKFESFVCFEKKTLEFELDSLHFRTVSEVETGDFEALLWMDINLLTTGSSGCGWWWQQVNVSMNFKLPKQSTNQMLEIWEKSWLEG